MHILLITILLYIHSQRKNKHSLSQELNELVYFYLHFTQHKLYWFYENIK